MIQSLEIKNYRNLEHLRIESLSGVNLITGKNNTGKSTLLEAVALYVSDFDINTIIRILVERGDYSISTSNNSKKLEYNIKAFTSCFNNRKYSFSSLDSIIIGELEDTLFGKEISSEKSVKVKFVRYYDEMIEDENQVTTQKRILINEDLISKYPYSDIGIEIRIGAKPTIFPLSKERLVSLSRYRDYEIQQNLQFVRTRSIDRGINSNLWDSVTLTDREKNVIDALKLIEPNLLGLSFVDEGQKNRIAKVKLSDTNSIVPLKSMGDGINRILTIILAMVNAENGVLLIDEFENGLHYSVQEKLWEIIFNLSDKLNVQVFATTHSNDTINSFESVLNSLNTNSGQVIRLDNVKGKIRQVQFSGQELSIAQSNGIEIR